MTNEIAYRILAELDEVESIGPEWDALLEHSPCNRAFSSSTWYLAACRHHQDLTPYVIVARRGSQLFGVLPLAINEERRIAAFPTYLADYNDIIAAPEDSRVLAGLLRYALSPSHEYRSLLLTDLRPDSNCVRALLLIEPDSDRLVKDHSACPHVRFLSGYHEYLHTRSRAFQTSLKRAVRKAERSDLIIRELQPESFSPERLPHVFLSLHLDRHGSTSCFARQTEQSFVGAALPALFAERRLRAFALLERERIVGINVCMLGADSLCYWNSGFLADAARWSPGRLLIDAGVRQAYAMGLAEYDLLRGSEDYKAGWANRERPLYRIELKPGIQN